MSNPRNINQVVQGAAASQPAKLPGIPAVQTDDRATADVLKAIKERLEVREGERGNPFEATVTVRQLAELGLIRTTPAPCRVTELSGIAGQTKAGEFVTISLNDLAVALSNVVTGTQIAGTTSPVDNTALIENVRSALSREIANLRSTQTTTTTGTTYTPSANMLLAEASFSTTPADVYYAGSPRLDQNTVLYVDYSVWPPAVYRVVDLATIVSDHEARLISIETRLARNGIW